MRHAASITALLCTFFASVVVSGAAPVCAGDEKPKAVAFVGKVTHVDVEGGFWGIVAEDGTHYDAIRLDAAYQKEGLRVRVEGSLQPDAVSSHMWGKIIAVTKITLADAATPPPK